MKELSTEEKAKRYDEAIKKAKEFKNNPFAGYDGTDLISSLFPELVDSEDERIRKEIIAFLTYYHTGQGNSVKYDDGWIAWLEKQAEQKSLNDIAKEVIKDKDAAISFLKSYGIMNEDGELADEYKIEQCEQKPVINTITPEESLGIDSETYSKIVDECIYGERKPAWSEEDKRIIDNLISQLGNLYARKLIKEGTKDKYVNFLKFLKDRYTWKPSDEQMEAINTAINAFGKGTLTGKYLKELYEQLKKLMEK